MSNYYNRTGKKLKVNKEMTYLKSGACSDCMTDNKIVLKKYKEDVGSSYRISPEMFDVLKTIDDDHFIKLYDIYSSSSFLEAIFRKVGTRVFYPELYTSKFYQEEKINVLEKDNDYLTENIYALEKVFTELALKHIAVNDLRRANVVVNSNCMTVIDPDLFYFSKSSEQFLIGYNKILLLDLIKQVLIDGVQKEQNYKKIGYSIIDFIDSFNMNCNTDLSYEFSKKLSKVKKPIDYFRK